MQSKLRTSLAAMLATGLLLLACQVALLDAAPLAGAQLRPANSEVIEPGTFYGGYYTVEEIQGFLDQEVAAHPGLAEKVDFGDSWCKAHVGACTLPELYNGYDMWAIRITNRSIAGPKPVFWVDGGIHAREIATPEVAMSYIRWLLDNYDTNADAHWLVDYHDIWVAPMINPDGHHIVEAGGSGSNPYFQRKNANNAEGCTTWPPSTDQFGVDLNRNFPFMWNCCGGSTGEPCDPNYRGASPASEDETRAVVAKIRELIPDQRGPNLEDLAPITTTGIYQDLHSHGRVVIYPWAHTGTATPNEADIANISKHMIALDAGGNGYPLCDHCASIIDGSAMDWAYGELGVPSYATELSGDSFYPPYPRVQEIWNENRGALVYMAKIARTPYLLAKGPDANGLGATPITVTQGASVEVTATINYNWKANAYLQNVTAAEYYVDAPPWMGGTPGPMEPADGSFDSPTEGVRATVTTATLTTGRHLLMVRGRGVKSYEGYESWGPFTARFLDVLPPGSGTPTPGPATTPTITSTATPSPCGASFSDVHPADYFYEPISYLYCRGAISGYGDGTFRPYNNTTRGQLCKIVVLAEGWSLYAPSSATFLDVPLDHPFYAYIETAHVHGAISGYADGTFRPGNEVTRGQLCKIIVLAQGRSLVGEGQHFMDVLPGNPFFAYVETAFDRDIITGYADHTFRWGSHATRGQAGSVLYRARTP